MSTRSAIGVMHGNKAKVVYCHHDGYLNFNGQILQEHYSSAKANNLVALGDMSSLGQNLAAPEGVTHSYRDPLIGVCVFYGRDRGEDGCEFQVCQSDAEMFDTYSDCEYFYIMKDGVWFVSQGEGTEWKVLAEALKEEADASYSAPSATRLIGMEQEA
jgi:hypothetical protein